MLYNMLVQQYLHIRSSTRQP